ncbi:glycosyltransferase family 2 protein [Maribellus maritimus]|uniref:glycosyltransferase family 2 protein n=1 Tax=Maribellus maritimus TaxID=2870838 RepID=UPI001EEB0A07|nr:glycosyltransferase family 2 protein [Maribellus maritimus]MCG6188442.1 glycosyltransferase family 2 protein [Maribellus maritimus]
MIIPKTAKIGIVTVLYNSEEVLPDFFKSLEEQNYQNIELYVVNNASPDNSLPLSKDLSKKVWFPVKFIECPENYGIAKGNNLGIFEALSNRCSYILLANNDIELNPNTISILFEEMMQEDATMAVPKIYYHGTNIIWAAGGKFIYHTGSVRHIGVREEDKGQFEKRCNIPYAPTCFMLIDASVFQRIGFMDERYFVYFDDTDFVYRAVIKGKENLIYIPRSIVWHKEGGSTGGFKSDFSIRYQTRNMVYFTLKQYTFFHQLVVFAFNFSYYLLKASFKMSARQRRIMRRSYWDGVKVYVQSKKESSSISYSERISNITGRNDNGGSL